jgi:hypothetical protein
VKPADFAQRTAPARASTYARGRLVVWGDAPQPRRVTDLRTSPYLRENLAWPASAPASGARFAVALCMQNLSHASRVVAAGAAASAICAGAGIVAFTGQAALKASSLMLVAALVVAIVGYAYADNRRLGWGILAIVAATLPLFGALYAIGEVIMRHLGVMVAGGALIAVSVAVAAGTIALTRVSHRLGGYASGSKRG